MKVLPIFLALTALCSTAHAQVTRGPNDVYVRVVDVGAGLCTITAVPGNNFMVYDAGHWQSNTCLSAAHEIIGDNPIELMVISHSDADHLGEADDILSAFEVRKILRTGFHRTSGSWVDFNNAVAEEARAGATVLNLSTHQIAPGTSWPLSGATVTFVAGWPRWVGSGPTASELRNAVSIVVRLDYAGKSVLFTGDTVGRRLTDPDTACKDAEAHMVQWSAVVRLRSDVMIAPHHGANNGSSSCFIAAVDPQFVIFSAGHDHHHPTAAAAQRYIAHGITTDRMFRTDRGDDEGGHEWADGRVPECTDGRGDDDVEILLPQAGPPVVAYRQSSSGC